MARPPGPLGYYRRRFPDPAPAPAPSSSPSPPAASPRRPLVEIEALAGHGRARGHARASSPARFPADNDAATPARDHPSSPQRIPRLPQTHDAAHHAARALNAPPRHRYDSTSTASRAWNTPNTPRLQISNTLIEPQTCHIAPRLPTGDTIPPQPQAAPRLPTSNAIPPHPQTHNATSPPVWNGPDSPSRPTNTPPRSQSDSAYTRHIQTVSHPTHTPPSPRTEDAAAPSTAWHEQMQGQVNTLDARLGLAHNTMIGIGNVIQSLVNSLHQEFRDLRQSVQQHHSDTQGLVQRGFEDNQNRHSDTQGLVQRGFEDNHNRHLNTEGQVRAGFQHIHGVMLDHHDALLNEFQDERDRDKYTYDAVTQARNDARAGRQDEQERSRNIYGAVLSNRTQANTDTRDVQSRFAYLYNAVNAMRQATAQSSMDASRSLEAQPQDSQVMSLLNALQIQIHALQTSIGDGRERNAVSLQELEVQHVQNNLHNLICKLGNAVKQAAEYATQLREPSSVHEGGDAACYKDRQDAKERYEMLAETHRRVLHDWSSLQGKYDALRKKAESSDEMMQRCGDSLRDGR